MLHYAPLDHAPKGFRIPEQYQDRFAYDEQRHCLTFDGPMFKTTFDRLSVLSRDFDYQRSLEQLFRVSVPEPSKPQGHAKATAVGIAVLGVAAAIALALLL
jgi:hypothetical protein